MVVFRVDGTHAVGFGHFFRCLALADAFRVAGWDVVFAGTVPDFMAPQLAGMTTTGPLPGGSADWQQPIFQEAIQGADLLVTDMYAIDRAWRAMSPIPVVAIADDPDEVGDAALGVLPTWFNPTDGAPHMLTAPDHVLIRRDFQRLRHEPKRGDRLLINCGGGDDKGLTLAVLRALREAAPLRSLGGTVVLGAADDAYVRAVTEALSGLPRMQLRTAVRDMAELVAAHDWAFGCPAGAALERACLGLAQVLTPIATNQAALGAAFAARGAAQLLPAGASAEEISSTLAALLGDPRRRSALAASGFAMIDGRGPARVVVAAEELLGDLRA